MNTREYKKDMIIFKTGDEANYLYVIMYGSVLVTEKNGETERMSANTVVGDRSLKDQILQD